MSPAERRQMMLAGPIVSTILALALPNVLNVAMQSLVSISDGWFVGHLGTVDLAAHVRRADSLRRAGMGEGKPF